MTPTNRPWTVALPTCNGARYVAETLRSVLAQAEIAFDLIVCDDRSEDDTLAIVRREAGDRARVEVNPERLGLAGNWNRCASKARTPLIAIVHQDDLLLPGHLAAHQAVFDRDAAIAMVCGATEVIDERGRPIPPSVIERPDLGPEDRIYPPGAFLAELATRNPIRCSAVSLKVAALLEAGGFDPSYRYAVDWECWIRLARHWPIAWLARPTVSVRWHPESETHRFRRGSADLDELSRLLALLHSEYAEFLPDPVGSRRDADRFLSRAFLNRALDALHAGDHALSRGCLRRSVALRPSVIGSIALDPRLSVQLAAVTLAPRWAARQFARAARDEHPPSAANPDFQ